MRRAVLITLACSLASVGKVIALSCAEVSSTTSFPLARSPCNAMEAVSGLAGIERRGQIGQQEFPLQNGIVSSGLHRRSLPENPVLITGFPANESNTNGIYHYVLQGYM